MQITIIVNGQDQEALREVRGTAGRFRELDHEASIRGTRSAGDARVIAHSAAAAGVPLIVAVGGDGTVNEAANGIHEFLVGGPGRDTATGGPRLAIVPRGTANDLASALQIPSEMDAALDVALGGSVMETDVGLLNDRCFLNVSSGGVGAEATEEASTGVKQVLGPLAYLFTGVKKLAALRPSAARFTAAEVVYDGPFLVFAVGNSRQTGGGNHLTPRADLADGLLDLCIVRETSRAELLALLPDLRSGHHLDHPAVIYRQVPAITVAAEDELRVNVDGEPLRGNRFEYRISKHRLRLMIPRR